MLGVGIKVLKSMLHEPHSFLIYVNIDGSWYKACCESKTKSSIQVKFILFDCIFYKCEGVMIYVLISLQPGRYRVEGIKENVSNPIAQSRYEGYFF